MPLFAQRQAVCACDCCCCRWLHRPKPEVIAFVLLQINKFVAVRWSNLGQKGFVSLCCACSFVLAFSTLYQSVLIAFFAPTHSRRLCAKSSSPTHHRSFCWPTQHGTAGECLPLTTVISGIYCFHTQL